MLCVHIVIGMTVGWGNTISDGITRTNPVRKFVVATYHLSASEDQRAEGVRCYFFIPEDDVGQEIHSLLIQPQPEKIGEDAFGRKIAHIVLPRIYKGQHAVVRWIAAATLYELHQDLSAAEPNGGCHLSPDDRKRYLADGRLYNLTSPVVQRLAGELAPDTFPESERVVKIWNYLKDHLTYDRSGSWDPADTVLERNSGSCSEYTYAFISLCRAAGIPARYVGATWCRSLHGPSFDVAHHRWGEAYLDGLGWVGMDPLKSTLNGSNMVIQNRALVLGHGDRGGSPLGSAYTGKVFSDSVVIDSCDYFWCDPISSQQAERVFDAAGLRTAKRVTRRVPPERQSVDRLGQLNEQLCIPFLTDFLWSESKRTARMAAESICRIDIHSARQIRYTFMTVPGVADALSMALEAGASDRSRWRSRSRHDWLDCFDGRRAQHIDEEYLKRFHTEDGALMNATGKPAMLLTNISSRDNAVIDLYFSRSEGGGRIALIFGDAGNGTDLQLTLNTLSCSEPNRVLGTQARQPEASYAITPNEAHRILLGIQGCEIIALLDGRPLFTMRDAYIGPGRIGISVLDTKTVIHIKHLRLLNLSPREKLIDVFSDEKRLSPSWKELH